MIPTPTTLPTTLTTKPPTNPLTLTLKGCEFLFVWVEGNDQKDAQGEFIHKPFEMGTTFWEYSQPIKAIRQPGFYLGQTPVTQQQWLAITGQDPSHFKGDSRPVESVSWDDVNFLFLPQINEVLSKQAGQGQLGQLGAELKNAKIMLPREAQWEYAACGGIDGCGPAHQKGVFSGSINDADLVAWYEGNSGGQTQPVGLKAPNVLGLLDMSGNVWEWCADRWHNYDTLSDNGQFLDEGKSSSRVLRGGSWDALRRHCAVSARNLSPSGNRHRAFGLRLLLARG